MAKTRLFSFSCGLLPRAREGRAAHLSYSPSLLLMRS
jgi:hypothetical protein